MLPPQKYLSASSYKTDAQSTKDLSSLHRLPKAGKLWLPFRRSSLSRVQRFRLPAAQSEELIDIFKVYVIKAACEALLSFIMQCVAQVLAL